jgi:hypothetical protein
MIDPPGDAIEAVRTAVERARQALRLVLDDEEG